MKDLASKTYPTKILSYLPRQSSIHRAEMSTASTERTELYRGSFLEVCSEHTSDGWKASVRLRRPDRQSILLNMGDLSPTESEAIEQALHRGRRLTDSFLTPNP